MAKIHLSFQRIMLAGGLLFSASAASQAESNTYELRQNQLTSRRIGVDVRTIEQRQQRRDYQIQQQWNREDERRTASQPMELRVPTMRPACPLPINGNLNPGALCR